MRGYIQKALSQFQIDTTEPLQRLRDSYVEVPVQWSEGEWDIDRGVRIEESPLTLLADTTQNPFHSLGAPYIAFLIGPSGVGKTEMIKQTCAYAAALGQTLEVLPVKLTQCTWRQGLTRFPEQHIVTDQFRDYLFSSLGDPISAGVIGELVDKVILEDMHRGSVLLALDGLDEIVFNR